MRIGTMHVITLSEGTFIERFKPELNDEGGLYRQRDHNNPADATIILIALASNRLWTVVEGDTGKLYCMSGLHLVNRLYHLITAVPVPPNSDIGVNFE